MGFLDAFTNSLKLERRKLDFFEFFKTFHLLSKILL